MYTATFLLLCGCVCQVFATNENATVALRQAIGVALVQSGALNGHPFVNNKTRSEDKQHSCNKTITYCDPFISRQAKFEQESIKNMPSNFNITESAYNASIVHALHINKTMVTRNKTIIFLHDHNNEEKPKIKPSPSTSDSGYQTLNDLVNFTIPLEKTLNNRTITINANRSMNSNFTKARLDESPVSSLKDFNLTIPKPAIMNNRTMDVGKINIVNQTAPNIIKTLPLPANKTKVKNDVSNDSNTQGSKHGPFSEIVYNQHVLPSFQNFQTYRLNKETPPPAVIPASPPVPKEPAIPPAPTPTLPPVPLTPPPAPLVPVIPLASPPVLLVPAAPLAEPQPASLTPVVTPASPPAPIVPAIPPAPPPVQLVPAAPLVAPLAPPLAPVVTPASPPAPIVPAIPPAPPPVQLVPAAPLVAPLAPPLAPVVTPASPPAPIVPAIPLAPPPAALAPPVAVVDTKPMLNINMSNENTGLNPNQSGKRFKITSRNVDSNDGHASIGKEYGRIIYNTLRKGRLKERHNIVLSSVHKRSKRKKHTTNARLATKIKTHKHPRKARFAFDYDSDRDTSQSENPLPIISNYMSGPDLVPLKDDPADNTPDLLSSAVKGRSDIWSPVQNEEAEKFTYSDSSNSDMLTEPRGHIALPDTDERSPVMSESVSPNSFVDHILSGRLAKNPDRLMEKQFIPVDGPMKAILKNSFSSILTDDKSQYNDELQPKQIVPTFVGNTNFDQHDSPLNDQEASMLGKLSPKTTIMNPDDAERRYQEEKVQDEELGMMLDKFDRETRKIASLYKYLGPKINENDKKNEALRDFDDQRSYNHYQENANRMDAVNNRDTVQSSINRDHFDLNNRGMLRDFVTRDSRFPPAQEAPARNFQYDSEQSSQQPAAPVESYASQRSFKPLREFEPSRQTQPSFARDEPPPEERTYNDQGTARNSMFNTAPQIEAPPVEERYNKVTSPRDVEPPPRNDGDSERNNFYGKEQWGRHESRDSEESFNRARIMKELLSYIKDKAAEKSKQYMQEAIPPEHVHESFHHEEPPYPVNQVASPVRNDNYPDFRSMYKDHLSDTEEGGRNFMEHAHTTTLEDERGSSRSDHKVVSYPNNILDFISSLSDVMHGKEFSPPSITPPAAAAAAAAEAARSASSAASDTAATTSTHSLEEEEAKNRDHLPPVYPPNERLHNLPEESALRDTLPNTIESPSPSSAAVSNFMDFSFKDNPFIPPESRYVPRTESSAASEQPPIIEGGKAFSDLLDRTHLANRKGMVMLLISAPNSGDDDSSGERKESVKHKELTPDGVKRVANDKKDENPENEDSNFSKDLKTATDFVLGDAVKAGNITKDQRDDIEEKLGKILDAQEMNMTKAGEDKAEKFVSDKKANITASSMKILHEISGEKKSVTPKMEKKLILRLLEVPADPVMYLTFDVKVEKNVLPDSSGNHNDGQFENKADISTRILGTCGKAAELNEGSVTWSGENFKRKPTKAVTIAMWVKTKKNGVIDWFASKKGHKVFYTKSNGTAIPSKVWTHVAGTFDTATGLARIYINGVLERESQQFDVARLPQNWLVNGIGSQFGDDSMQLVDELFIYDRALNISEIRTLVNRCVFNRMIFHYGFANGNKTNTNDQSGLENDGILTGGAKMKSDCGRCGSCLDLQAGPDPSLKIQQVSVKNLPRVKVSIAVWVSLNDTKGVHNIFKTESSKGNIGYNLQVKNGRVRWYIASDKGHTIVDNTTKNEVVPEALWTHIIVSYNNENGKVAIYANSLVKFKDTVPEAKRKYLPINWDNDASIGDSSFHGYLDEFIMYNWELDGSEALYVRNYCADHPKLVRFTVRVPLTKKSFIAGDGDGGGQNFSLPLTLRNMVPILLKTKNVFTLPFSKGVVSEKTLRQGNIAAKSTVPKSEQQSAVLSFKYPNPIIVIPKNVVFVPKKKTSALTNPQAPKNTVPVKKPVAPKAAPIVPKTAPKNTVPVKNPIAPKTVLVGQQKPKTPIVAIPKTIKMSIPLIQKKAVQILPPKAIVKAVIPFQQNVDPFLSLMWPKATTKANVPIQQKLTPVRFVAPKVIASTKTIVVPAPRELVSFGFLPPKIFARPKTFVPKRINSLAAAVNIRKTATKFGVPRKFVAPKTLIAPRIVARKTLAIPARSLVRKPNSINIRATAKSIISIYPKRPGINIPKLRSSVNSLKPPPAVINRSLLSLQKSKQPRRSNPAWFTLYKKLLARKNLIQKRTLSNMNIIARQEPNVIYDMLK